MEKHTPEIREIEIGDSVTVDTTLGEQFEANCVDRFVEYSDGLPEESLKTTTWRFEVDNGGEKTYLYPSIEDGIASSKDGTELPQHNEIWNSETKQGMGFIKEISKR